jgi:DNA-binding CsgD family transcriptional regulator
VVSSETGQRGGADAPVGRAQELAFIDDLLARARSGHGAALLVVGDPGLGKTLLLGAAAQIASGAGMQVLRACGVEFEADISYSGLNQALLPIYPSIGRLSTVHRDALNVALGLGEGPPPDRLVVCNAALAAVQLAATERPLLMIADDVAWLDRASASVLGFMARRLGDSPVGFLVAARSEQEGFFNRVGLPELELQPLGNEAAAALVDAHFPDLAPTVRARILADAQGNPLALLELPLAMTDAQQEGRDPLPPTLALGRRLQALFAARIEALPAETRHLLLLMALDGTGTPHVPRPAGGVHASEIPELAAAEREGVAHIDPNTHRAAFRHPLIRSAVVERSTTDQLRRAHQELAKRWADQPDLRAWHLAGAAAQPDEEVAVLLEQMAERVLRRGDAVGAVTALRHAAELSPSGAGRGRRLAHAAYIGADVAGALQDASRLLAEARAADPRLGGSLPAAVTAAIVLLDGEGDIDTAHSLLVGALHSWAEAHDRPDNVLEEALRTLLMVCHFGGRPELWPPFDRLLARFGAELPLVLSVSSKLLADPVRTAGQALEPLDRLIDGLRDETDPAAVVRVGIAAYYVHRVAGCRQALWRVVRDGREGGPVGPAITALILLSYDDFLTGNWGEARQLADEAVALCLRHGSQLHVWPGRYVQAVLAAATGDDEAMRAITDATMQWAVPRGAFSVRCYAWHARTLGALGRGDFDEAYRTASAISPAGTFASHAGFALQVPMDLVEAAVRAGHREDATAHVIAMQEAGIAHLSPRLALLAAGSAAIVAPDERAPEMFDLALATPGAGQWPFDRARVQLCYGERLRRLRATTEARSQLSAALETFETLGARPWATRASNELRAAGQTRPRTGEYTWTSLTAQEREIAELAAAGLTNKEIAARLFLSHRTVGGHLHRAFPKLGVTTRAALRDALAGLPDEPEPDIQDLTPATGVGR